MQIPKEWLQYAPKPKPLTDNQKWNVFLSYRSVNRAWVLSLYDVLTELGYKVFLDQYVLKASDDLVTELQDALANSQAGVLIWSSAAQDSEWVKHEYSTLVTMSTNDKGFYFIPVKIDNTKLLAFANNKLFIDFSDYPDGPNGGDLIKLIYGIDGQPMSAEAVRFANEQDEISKEITANVNGAIINKKPDMIKKLFEQGGLPWQTSPALGCRAVDGLIKLKQYNDAITMVEIIADQFKRALRPKQLKALALARRGGPGDLDLAQQILATLYSKNYLDPETMGIYGRTWMDRYEQSHDPEDLKQSRYYYAEAFEKAPDDYYTGINAAAKSVFIGTNEDLDKAAEYASRVEKITGTTAVPGDYWKTATIGESFLIKKKYKEAAEMYGKAIAMARHEKGSHESTLLQAKRLMEVLKPTEDERNTVIKAFDS
ncbi:MAG: toll/interleukin-1 receptor domain-containing protein [Chitinophagaceae bacterium]